MSDPYLYEGTSVLKNKLGIRQQEKLDLVESEASRGRMLRFYKRGFQNFSPAGLRESHRELFQDIYEWAGEYRIINMHKREEVLGGVSVWYSNDEAIPQDLEKAFQNLNSHEWRKDSREMFVKNLTRLFPPIWKVHPFREGNTRTTVMMITFFVEYHGYQIDRQLLAQHARYVRDAFVMASLEKFSEHEHLERILKDAVKGGAERISQKEEKKNMPKKKRCKQRGEADR